MTVEEQREMLKVYVDRLKEAGIKYELFDYGLSLFAIVGDKKLDICYMYRPERDLYEGYKLIDEKVLDAFIEENKGVVE